MAIHQAQNDEDCDALASTVAYELAIKLFLNPALDSEEEKKNRRQRAGNPAEVFASLGKATDRAAVAKNLRAAADILEARPIEAPIKADGTRDEVGAHSLRPADPIDAAAWMLVNKLVGKFPMPEGQPRVEVPEAWLRKQVEDMPPEERLRLMRQFGADGDDITIRRSLKRVIGAKFRPGRPTKKSGN